ncbi:type IV secretory system conjugative DNA transfer family protein [Cytobacillus oceanisediminis]|uniref:type IV secretory system conjugative DNA transfer family protein n=1 Tax=Cytobacillus oceanisediminis TaxID=665099 RepID=UPI00203EDC49|nr:TraM recognition domain-containing protein [Cytobacillus oceanisediminis]MCM3403001.1 TraG/TraD/VirD4 family protein [Cytobacillus oceanisediminis]
MTSNPLFRFLTENKKVPFWLNIGLHAISFNIFYSFLCMSLAVFFLHPEWDSQAAQIHLPFIGLLAPYSFYTQPAALSYFFGIFSIAWLWGTWLFSTRVQTTNKTIPRRIFSFFLTWASFCLIIIFYSLRLIRVIGYEKVVSYHYTIDPIYQDMMHIGSLQMIGYLLLLIPIGVMTSFTVWLVGQYKEEKRIQEWFRTYKFESGWIGRFGEEAVNKLPDIQLARNAETNAPVILQGESRQLGTLLIGPPGSGKTSIKIKTSFRTDLGHIQRMINAYPKYVRKYGYGTQEFIRNMANHLIGSIIIEPAKDLCDDAYELAIEHNIPEEFIVYLDPSNPNTPGFNLMVGPTAEVVETITSVLESVAETKDEFFKQAARAVLKHYVYLLKFAKGDNCTILDLDDLYQDPRRAMDLLEELEKTIPIQEEIDAMDQDGRIHWIIVKKIIRWFRNEGLSIQTSREGLVEKFPAGHEHAGKPKVVDLQFEFTRQTRNLLSDITKNPYLARILYAENAVDLNKLFTKGGILLVNTDLGNLKALSAIFGKLVLLCVQNAVFRRKGNEHTRSMVSFYADEFYDYMNEDFLQLTSQGRKYKFAPLVACQSLTQFGVKFGKDFTESMLGTIRNTIVYGGTSLYDTEMLSKYLGTEVVEELQIRESYTPTYMDTPSFSVGESISQKEKEIATSDDIMFQEFRYSYIRMVDDKSSKKAIRAIGDFVDTSHSDKWKKALKKDALNSFLEDWRKVDTKETNVVEPEGNEIDALRKELNDINKAQEENRKENEERTETNDSINRLNPFSLNETSVGIQKDMELLNPSTHTNIALEYPLLDKRESIKPSPNIQKKEQEQEPPPAVESPFMANTSVTKTTQSTISFSAAFGTQDKEKLHKLTKQKNDKVLHPAEKPKVFLENEMQEQDMHLEQETLKEVSLDNTALNFINQLKKTSQNNHDGH